MNDKQPQSHELFFDPQNHPDDPLKSFTEFSKTFLLRYAAQFPDPPKVSLDSALQRWKITHTTDTVTDPKPTIEQYDEVVENWQSEDKVAKFLGMFSSTNFHNDWVAAQPNETLRKKAGWTEMVSSSLSSFNACHSSGVTFGGAGLYWRMRRMPVDRRDAAAADS